MKQLLLCLFLALISVNSVAQNYIFEYDVDFKFTDEGDRRYMLHMLYNTQNNPTTMEVNDFAMDREKFGKRVSGKILIPVTEGPINDIFINTDREVRFVVWHNDCGNTSSLFLLSGNNNHCFDLSNRNNDWNCLNYHSIITQRKLIMYPDAKVSSSGNQDNLLPSEDKINLQGTVGFPNDVYKWQFRVDNESVWSDLPPQFQNQQSIEVSASDLFRTRLEDLVGHNVFFRLNLGCNQASNIIVLNVRKSSPHIASIINNPNTCFSEENGSLTIFLDRSLNQNESLNFIITEVNSGEVQNISNVTSLNDDNSVSTPSNLPPGQYKVEIISLYKGSPGYSESKNHYATSSFIGPTALDFNYVKRDIYCFNGKDGTIKVNANGGNGGYKILVKKRQDLDYTLANFASANEHIISNLDTGTYQIRVMDKNGCYKKDDLDNEVVHEVTISQPLESLKVDHKLITEPTAFGVSDGRAEIVIVGGTTIDGNYKVEWSDINGNLLTNFKNTSNPFKTTLYNASDGKYIVKVTDDNHLLANAENISGCMVMDTITITQPEPLSVLVEELNYISCKGDSDGRLRAKASGGVVIPDKQYNYEWFKEINGTFRTLNQFDSILVDVGNGIYKVRITDQNHISKESDKYMIAEPEALSLALTSTETDCSLGNNGTASVKVTGGTPPYGIEWSNGDSGLEIKDLTEGSYFVYVTDAHGCYSHAKVDVAGPNPMIITNDKVRNPTCFGGNDGTIVNTVSGGVPPYNFSWSNGYSSQNLFNLSAGNYILVITDARGCTKTVAYNLTDPEKIIVNLGPDITLCVDQNHKVDATIANGSIYSWTSDNGFKANTANVLLSAAGSYYLEVLTENGCSARDTIKVHKSLAVIQAEFVVTTQAFKNEIINLVNISSPQPESIEWLVPKSPDIKIISRTDENLQLLFSVPGLYNIGIKTKQGDCFKVFNKQITVMEGTAFIDIGEVKEPFIKLLKIAPNPSNGNFNVKIELEEASKIKLRLLNTITGQVIESREERGSSTYNLPYNLMLSTGIYVLILETAKGNLVHKVLIN